MVNNTQYLSHKLFDSSQSTDFVFQSCKLSGYNLDTVFLSAISCGYIKKWFLSQYDLDFLPIAMTVGFRQFIVMDY